MAESDAELAGQALSGSEHASRELVRRYQRPVFNLIVRMVRDSALAEDLSQETFIKVFSHLDKYDASYKFANWILKIAHNTAIDSLRRRRPPTSPLEDEEGRQVDAADHETPGPFAVVERRELGRMLDAAIDRLRPEYREVVVLRYQEDLGYEEIADILDLPLGTVKSYLHRARAELAEMVRAAGWTPEGGLQPVTGSFRRA